MAVSESSKWLVTILGTVLGGSASLVLSSNNAIAVLAGSTLGSAAGTAIVSKRNKNQNAFEQSNQGALAEAIPKKVEIAQPSEQQALSDENSANALVAYLKALNVEVEHFRSPQNIDATSDRIALFIGSKYSSVGGFYKTIKRNLSTGKKFTFALSKSSQQDISNCTQLGDLLYKSSFLSSYRYLRSEKLIVASTQTRGDMINFLTGEWFERYVYQEVARLLAKHQVKYEYLLNSKIRLSNQDGFELDLLFLVNGELLWVECKTKSDISDCFQRYYRHQKMLKVPESRAFLVALAIPDEQAVDLTKRWQITVANQNNFIEKISVGLGLNQEAALNLPPH